MSPLYRSAGDGSNLVVEWKLRLVFKLWIGTCWPCSLRCKDYICENRIGPGLLALLPPAKSINAMWLELLWLYSFTPCVGLVRYQVPTDIGHKVAIIVNNVHQEL